MLTNVFIVLCKASIFQLVNAADTGDSGLKFRSPHTSPYTSSSPMESLTLSFFRINLHLSLVGYTHNKYLQRQVDLG